MDEDEPMDVELLDFPVSRVLGFFRLVPGRDFDAHLITVLVTSVLVAIFMPAAIALRPFGNNKEIARTVYIVSMTQFFLSVVTTFKFWSNNWPYSSRTVVGTRNFTFMHEFCMSRFLRD